MRSKETKLAQAADFFSAPVDLERATSFSVQISTANESGLTATTTLQVTNDEVNWIDLGDAETLTTSQLFDVSPTAASDARVKVTITAGSADFTFNWITK